MLSAYLSGHCIAHVVLSSSSSVFQRYIVSMKKRGIKRPIHGPLTSYSLCLLHSGKNLTDDDPLTSYSLCLLHSGKNLADDDLTSHTQYNDSV